MKNLICRIYSLFSFFLIILACIECKKGVASTASSDSLESSVDSVKSSSDSVESVGIDSLQTGLDTITAKPDTLVVKNSIENNISIKNDIEANTAVYAPQGMTKDAAYTVFAMVSLKKIEEAKKRLIEDVKKSNQNKTNQKDIKFARTKFSTNKIKVILKYDDDVFKIIDSDDGIIKSIDNNNEDIIWKWNIKAKNYGANTPLIFIFQSVDDNEVIFEQQIDVNVNVSVKNTFGGYFQYLADEPKYTIPSIILPLITFLSGIFLRRRKSAAEKNSN